MSNVWTDELHGRKGREIPKSNGGVQPVTRNQLERIVARTPEVLVQISRSSVTSKDPAMNKDGSFKLDAHGNKTYRTTHPSPRDERGLAALVNYIGRTDKETDDLELTDELGLSYAGRDELKDATKHWNMPESSNRREVLHVILGMPKFCSDGKTPTDVASVERAATSTAEKLFKNHYFLIAHHRDSDGGHPHAHVLVRMEPKSGYRRLNPRRNDLERYRNTYAKMLRENGVQANATSAVQRLSRNRNIPQAAAQFHKKRGTQPNRTVEVSALMKKQADYMSKLADAIEQGGDATLASKTRRYVNVQTGAESQSAGDINAQRVQENQHQDLHQQDHTQTQ